MVVKTYDSIEQVIDDSMGIIKKMFKGQSGDQVIITGEYPLNKVNHTNFIKLEEI